MVAAWRLVVIFLAGATATRPARVALRTSLRLAGGYDSASPWTRHVSADGREYYYNEQTGESSWVLPNGAVAATAAAVLISSV